MGSTSEFLNFDCCRVIKTTFAKIGDVASRVQKQPDIDFLLRGGVKTVVSGVSYVKEIGEAPMDKSFSGKITGEALENDTIWVSVSPKSEYLPFDRKIHILVPGQRITLYQTVNSMFYVADGSGTIHGYHSLQEYTADTARKIQPNQRLIFTAEESTVLAHIWRRHHDNS